MAKKKTKKPSKKTKKAKTATGGSCSLGRKMLKTKGKSEAAKKKRGKGLGMVKRFCK